MPQNVQHTMTLHLQEVNNRYTCAESLHISHKDTNITFNYHQHQMLVHKDTTRINNHTQTHMYARMHMHSHTHRHTHNTHTITHTHTQTVHIQCQHTGHHAPEVTSHAEGHHKGKNTQDFPSTFIVVLYANLCTNSI